VGVLDKSALILSSLELGPQSLSNLVDVTGLPRPTLHRLAAGLETHRLVERDSAGHYRLGSRMQELATARTQDPVPASAREVLAQLRDRTGESAQLFRRTGDRRVCIAVADRESGLRDTVPIGADLPLTAGSAAQVLLAWEPFPLVEHLVDQGAFTPTTLTEVRARGWAESVGEREAGVASVSAPLVAPSGRVIAALSVSGPIQRFGDQRRLDHADAVRSAAASLSSRAFPNA
jgi:DNA-binding IclR family transcriptional regulator